MSIDESGHQSSSLQIHDSGSGAAQGEYFIPGTHCSDTPGYHCQSLRAIPIADHRDNRAAEIDNVSHFAVLLIHGGGQPGGLVAALAARGNNKRDYTCKDKDEAPGSLHSITLISWVAMNGY
jgi:hypothetical protein